MEFRKCKKLVIWGASGHALVVGNAVDERGSFLRENVFSVATILHPSSIIASDVFIGEETVVLAGVVIDPASKIGKYCIINNKAVISHDREIEDGVHICPGVCMMATLTHATYLRDDPLFS